MNIVNNNFRSKAKKVLANLKAEAEFNGVAFNDEYISKNKERVGELFLKTIEDCIGLDEAILKADKMERDDIEKNHISCMLHSLGIETRRNGDTIEPNKRYRPIPVAFRNHWNGNNKELNQLCEIEFAFKYEKFNQVNYYITTQGIQYLKDIGYNFKKEEK